MKKRIGISTFEFQAKYGDKGALKIARELGVDAVDFCTSGKKFDITNPDSIYSRSDKEIVDYFTDIRNYADSLGVEIVQTHGRLRLLLPDEKRSEECLEMARKDLLAAKALGAPVTVMHGVQTNVWGQSISAEQMRRWHFERFNKVLEYAKEYGVKIASETLGDAPNFACVDFFADADEFLDVYERINAHGDNAGWFTLCIDTGHVRKAERYGTLGVGDFIRKIGAGKISCLHLHDNNGLTDQHRPPFTGSIDWEDTLNALDEVGYDGVYNIEAVYNCFLEGFELETARYAVELFRFALDKHYAKT